MRLYQLTSLQWAHALDGEGARKWGGRWNSIGTPAIYTGLVVSTALLEALVHLDPDEFPEDYTLVTYHLPDQVSRSTVALESFPENWRGSLEQPWFKQTGDLWLSSGESLLLLTPSVIVPCEYNAILNPRHPEMAQLRLESLEPFPLDPRFKH